MSIIAYRKLNCITEKNVQDNLWETRYREITPQSD